MHILQCVIYVCSVCVSIHLKLGFGAEYLFKVSTSVCAPVSVCLYIYMEALPV